MRCILYGLTAIVFLTTGCATARIWQEKNSQVPTKNEELQIALHQCEQNHDVAYYHKKAVLWSGIGTGTVLIPFLGLGMVIAGDALTDKYVLFLTKCMQENGFYYVERKSGRLRWNKLSDFEISTEQWNNEHPTNQIPLSPVTPIAGTQKIVTVTWTFANIRSGAGNEFPVDPSPKKWTHD